MKLNQIYIVGQNIIEGENLMDMKHILIKNNEHEKKQFVIICITKLLNQKYITTHYH